MTEDKNIRYIEDGESVYFPRSGVCFNRVFIRRYYFAKTIVAARRIASKHWSRAVADDIIHYLKEKKIIQ